jgi:hypothetical protein
MNPAQFFKRDDVSFALMSEVVDGVLNWVVLFENCRTSQCRLVISLATAGAALQHSIEIECAGGAAGTYRAPWPVPSDQRGRFQRLEVFADVSRPDGAGDSIKPAYGIPVESTSAPGTEFLSNLFMAVAAGHMLMRRHAAIEVLIPGNVASEVPGASSPQDRPLPLWVQLLIVGVIVIFAATVAHAVIWSR